MHLDLTFVLSLVVITVLTLALAGWLLSVLWRLFMPIFQNRGLWRAARSLTWRMQYSRRRRIKKRFDVLEDDDEDEDEDDELDSSTLRVLTALDAATIVVDGDDEVERASASAYRWSLVKNDEIANDQIAEAIQKTRQGEGRQKFDIVTYTADDLVKDSEEDTHVTARPHWLSVTVSMISERRAVVLISDQSEAKRFAQTRDDFVTNVAEQLLEPADSLASIGQAWSQSTNEVAARDGKVISTQARHMHKLVSDLLLLIQAQEKVTPSEENRLDLGALVRRVVDSMTPDRGVRIHVRARDGVLVNGSAVQIEAAVGKLTSNAVRYSKKNGVVTVVVDTARDENYAAIRVIDTGLGIRPDEQEHIFERFYRGSIQPNDAVARNEDAVGLGLAIVKHVALTHRGTVSVWSAPGQGSTFSLFLPKATK
ncbi:sensor histidine kinase [Alloscardovia macacae]|uniref:Sensor-like histidine kinase SenX3 n=1 Tax=Alloscardovia macacae TaxID=1160091 RepID=A0A261F7G9_9BIFI|nr:HAMP domain-containing sensor histidine kinase [Alloscardovia macacae]OZG55038.1 Sensor-like histidine kinase senX3 [Alloscardovia macacae]